MRYLDNENSAEHWKFINVKDKIVLDLGCGRWNKIETVHTDWLTTPEHFIVNGANKVIAVDIDSEEIDWLNNKFYNHPQYTFILQSITSVADIKDLYSTYKPNCVKCDIETNEKFLLELTKEEFCSIEEYYIETHGSDLYHKFLKIFSEYDYYITEQIELTHTKNYCKVLFAKKI